MNQIFKPHLYGSRITTYVLMAYYLDKLNSQGNLKEVLLKQHMKSYEEIVGGLKPEFNTEIVKIEFEAKQAQKKKENEQESIKDIESYLPRIFNQTLVTSCTIFDTYLVDCLSVIVEEKPNILKGLSNNSEITVANIIELGSYDKIFKKIKDELLSRFDFMGIKDKIKYLSSKLKIDIDTASHLKNHKESIQKDFPKGIEILYESYQKRNDIVHKDSQPLTKYDELIYLTQYMTIFMLELAFVMNKQFSISNDFMEKVKAINEDPEKPWSK